MLKKAIIYEVVAKHGKIVQPFAFEFVLLLIGWERSEWYFAQSQTVDERKTPGVSENLEQKW